MKLDQLKLRHQILGLLIVPLAFQLVTVSMMAVSFSRVDEVAKQETLAKKVIAICHDIDGFEAQVVMLAAAPRFFRSEGAPLQLAALREGVDKKTQALVELTKNNAEASKIAAEIARDSRKSFENLEDISGSYSPADNQTFSSQYFNVSDLLEAMKVLLERQTANAHRLRQMYGEVAKEFEPEALKARSQMRNCFILVVIANVVLVLGLAVLIQKKTLPRLQILMTNMHAFAKANRKHRRLDGTDELAELNQVFLQVAEERDRLEEIRKSMRAMVSHDLRSPLTSMNLSLEMVLEEDYDKIDPTVLRVLKRLHSEAQRLKRLSDTLLDIEKIEDGNLEVEVANTSCADVISIAIDALRSQAEHRKITIIEKIESDLVCLCDKDRTIQVIVNLLSNAVKFTPAKSTIEIVARRSAENSIHVEVLDQGPGVPEEKVNQLFNKFIQLDQAAETKKQGSGLGLYICKMLITAQKGDLGYKTRPEGGSCFWFDLPGAKSIEGAPSGERELQVDANVGAQG